MNEENIEKLGLLIDRLDDLIQMSSNPMPASLHWGVIKPILPEIRKEVFEVYIDEGGQDVREA